MNEKDEIIMDEINKIENGDILLPTVSNQIQKDYNNLISLQSKISNESDGFESTSRKKSFLSMDDTVLKIKEIKNKFNSLLIKIDYHVKNYIFVVSLLMTSCLNYNFLYLPFIFLGFIFTFFFISIDKKVNKNIKRSEYLTIIYSVLILIFKIIIIILIRKEIPFIEEKKKFVY